MCFDFIIMQLNQSHNANTNRDLIFMSSVSLSSPSSWLSLKLSDSCTLHFAACGSRSCECLWGFA